MDRRLLRVELLSIDEVRQFGLADLLHVFVVEQNQRERQQAGDLAEEHAGRLYERMIELVLYVISTCGVGLIGPPERG